MLCEMAGRERTRRGKRGLALRCFLVLNLSQTAIDLLLGLRPSSGGKGQTRTDKEGAAISGGGLAAPVLGRGGRIAGGETASHTVGGGIAVGGLGVGLMQTRHIVFQRSELALVYAVAADYAAGVIDCVVLEVYTRCFAGTGAGRAVAALLGIEINLEERPAGKESEDGSYGADGVAIGAASDPSQHADKEKCDGCDDECRQGANPDRNLIEGVAVVFLRYTRQDVVAEEPHGFQQVRGDAAETAVGFKQSHERTDACHKSNDEQGQNGVAQPAALRRIAVASGLVLTFWMQVCEEILQDAHRTDYGAIDATEEER